MNTSSSTTGFDWVMNSVRKNPEGFLLLAAGCALLLRTGSTGSTGLPVNQRQRSGVGEDDALRRNVRSDSDWSLSDGMSRAADSVREQASNIGDAVTNTAARYASAASDYAGEAQRTLADQAGRLADQAQSTVEDVVHQQPLAVALAGLAAGAAVASIFPASRMERETLGPAAQRLGEVANSAKDRVAGAASAAGEHLMNVAEEKGLNAEGLKEVTRNVAGTFEKSMTGQGDSPSGREKVSSGSPGTSRLGASEKPAGTGPSGMPNSGSSESGGAASSMPSAGSSGTARSGAAGSPGSNKPFVQSGSRADPKTSR